MKMKYKELEIELSLDGAIQVELFQLTHRLNDHEFLSLKLLTDGENPEDYVNMATVQPVIVREKECTGGQVIFQGKIETVYIKTEKGLSYLYLEAYSYTKDWERTDKSRSFLDSQMTYLDVARKVLADYGQFDIKDEITKDAKIPEMLLQYEESDWVFLRRLASHFGSSLLADASSPMGKVYFGVPEMNFGTELAKEDYVMEKDMNHFAKVLEPSGILSQEASHWNISTRKYLRMGEAVSFNKIAAVVTAMDISTGKGELVYRYTLSRKEGIRREKEQNPRIYGMSIPATVKERGGNQIRVHFDIDKCYEPSAHMKYFTYAIESSSFYCMPEVGSRVHIYFPEHDEQSAVAVHAIGSGSGGSGNKKPDNKNFSDPSGSAMNLTPDSLNYAPDSSGSIVLNLNKSGFVSLTGKNINIKTQKGLMAGGETPVQKLMISGENKVVLQIGDSGDDIITLEEKTDIKSALVTHKAETHSEASPSAGELEAELTSGDSAAREENNNQLASALAARKQESKQKVLNGVLSIATVVGAVALTVATGGAAGPLLIAVAGAKTAFAVADIAEGLDGYSKVNALDASRPANFIRDTVFQGNDAAYNLASGITDVVFDVVTGKALKNAGSAGKLSKILCSKSQVTNTFVQGTGSLLFGMIQEYETTGKVSLKNSAGNFMFGMFKGVAQTKLIGKVQGALKTDSRLVNKLVGAGVGTLSGTVMDVTRDALLPDRNVDVWRSLQENFVSSGLAQLLGEPIDAVSGAFLIIATDFILPDIRDSIKITRRYYSTNKQPGIMGIGWRFPYEGRLYQDGSKRHVVLDTGHHLTFEWDGEKAENISYGCGWFDLMKENDGWSLADRKEHRTYLYNDQGFLLSIRDRNGQTISFTYREEVLEGITTSLGYHLNLTMKEGHLIQISDNMGRTMQYRYEKGLLTDIVHMDQGITHYEYDENGFLTKAVDQTKVAYLENQYDRIGRTVLQTLANGDAYRLEYLDEERSVRAFSSVDNKTVLYKYGKNMEILAVHYEDGTGVFYEYDKQGYRTSVTDRSGSRKEWNYDLRGRLQEEKLAGGLITNYHYNQNDDLEEKADNTGRRFYFEYDDNHNLIEKKEETEEGSWFGHSYYYDRRGRLLEETDPVGNTTVYHYKENSGKPDVITYPDGEEVRFEYDRMGRMMAEESECGRKEYGYNANNFRTMIKDGEGNESRYLYDGMGRLMAMYPPKAWKERKGEYTYKYDFLDRLTDSISPDGSHSRKILDGEGKVLKEIHPNAYDANADDGAGVSFDYDSDGNQIRIHYPDGGCERLFYDAAGNRIKHVMPQDYDARTDDGAGWMYTYGVDGQLETVTGPDGILQAEYSYDISGNLTKKTDAMGRTVTYSYDRRNQLCEVMRPVEEKAGEVLYQRTTYLYNANGNKVEEHRHGGYWSGDGHLIEEDDQGLKLSFIYDKRDRLIQVKDGHGADIIYRYDIQGKRIYEEKVISKDVHQIIRYNYDKAGRLAEIKELLNSGLTPVKGEARYAITIYNYDENGNRTRIQTPEGYEIIREYDSCDRLIAERTLDKQNGIDRTVSITYDRAGNITRIARQGKGGELWELSYDYDLKNRITYVKDCLGPVFRYEYDKNDRLEKEILPNDEEGSDKEYKNNLSYAYDVYGNILTHTDGAGTVLEENQYLPDGNLEIKRTADGNQCTYTYGFHGKLTSLETLRSREAGKPSQIYTYDANGRITGVADGNGNRTNYDTDNWGRIRKVRNGDGGIETYTYDSMGNVTSTTDPNGGVINYRYNSQGKVCEIIDQDGRSEIFRYDREGRKILHIDRNQNQVRTVYNVDGNPVMETGCDQEGKNPVTRSWEYDSFGLRKKAIADGFCYTYEYRPDGKLMKKNSCGKTLISCTYGKDGSLKTMTDVTGKRLHYGYDWRGKLSSIKDDEGREIVRYSHRKDGRLETITHLSGIKTLYEYDTDGNISRLATFLSESNPLFDYRYEYDLNGNRTAKEGVCVMVEGSCAQKTAVYYRYDSMNRLTEERYDGDDVRYIYDRCGNRLEKTSVAGKETYCYNRRNQLIERNAPVQNYTYRYDAQGNILEETGEGEERRYHYNPFGQQTAVESDKLKLENFYDGELLRAGKSVNGQVSRFIFYNGELQAEADEDLNAISRHIPGYGLAASEVEGLDGYHAYHLDERNNTAYITGSQKNIENFYVYDAFGAIRSQSEEIQNRILYTGQQYDQETAQYYLRARFYNPVVGRFLQEDVYRGDGLNLYAYCANNPVMYNDPSGYDSKDCSGKDGGEPAEDGGTPGSKVKADTDTKGSGDTEPPKVTATFEHNGKKYNDVNPTARNETYKNDALIPGPEGQKGLSNINNTMNKAHAEIGAMNQSRLDGNMGGSATLTVTGEPVCNYCRSDVKKMSLTLDLDSLTVNEIATGKTYTFEKSTNDFSNVKDGGKRWE